MDGFQHGDSPFYPKELGIVDLQKWRSKLYHFLLPNDFHSFSPQEKTTFNRQIRVHGIKLENHELDISLAFLPYILKKIITISNTNETFISYKEGRYERELLLKHGAKYILDLQDLGCPMFNVLQREASTLCCASAPL